MTQSTSVNMAEIYRFLAHSMQYPSPDWMQADYFSVLDTFLAELGWDAEAQALRQSISESTDWLEPLQVEHTRLFVNAIPSVIAPPYGSVYLSADGMLYGPSAEKVKAFYREQGFALVGEADIPDHISFELEFLALLAEEGKSNEAEFFLSHHFRPWFPKFQARVVQEVRHPFYRVLVNLIDFFTREEL
ncbi:MAG: molecular chaperone TorD family protein [Pseudomonadota bacterium]